MLLLCLAALHAGTLCSRLTEGHTCVSATKCRPFSKQRSKRFKRLLLLSGACHQQCSVECSLRCSAA